MAPWRTAPDQILALHAPREHEPAGIGPFGEANLMGVAVGIYELTDSQVVYLAAVDISVIRFHGAMWIHGYPG